MQAIYNPPRVHTNYRIICYRPFLCVKYGVREMVPFILVFINN